jgi:hypothetical protein
MRETSKPAGKCTPYRRSTWRPESGWALRAALVGGAEDLPGTVNWVRAEVALCVLSFYKANSLVKSFD